MVHDYISKSLNKIGVVSKNVIIRNLINESYYFGYQWKDLIDKFTNYTHTKPLYKLIINDKSYILEKIDTYVVMNNFRIVNIDVYISSITPTDLQLTPDYQDNIYIMEKYMLDPKNKNKISKYTFKILENDGIFSVMDSNYNVIEHNKMLESSIIDGYMKSSINIASLLENFIELDE